MPSIVITGPFGSGKSALMSWFGSDWARKHSVNLWANYGLAGSQPIESVEHLYTIFRAVVCLDEFWKMVDSRNFKDSKAMLDWWMEARKQRCWVLATAQAMHQLDKRVRDNADIEWACMDLGGNTTQVISYRLFDGKKLNKFSFYRPVSHELYSTFERAGVVRDTPGARASPSGRAPGGARNTNNTLSLVGG